MCTQPVRLGPAASSCAFLCKENNIRPLRCYGYSVTGGGGTFSSSDEKLSSDKSPPTRSVNPNKHYNVNYDPFFVSITE